MVNSIHKIDLPRTAARIADLLEPESWDRYHVDMKNAASRLVAEGRGHLIYIAQYSSGTCEFGLPDPEDSRFFQYAVLVKPCKTS